MSLKLLQNNKVGNYLLLLRSFSISKNFDTAMRRKYSCGDGFKAIDPCPNYDPSLVMHKSLQPPPEISPCFFRQFETCDEILGPGADKCGVYKNPEYYGYHKYSYTDIYIYIQKMLELRKILGNKVCPPGFQNKEEIDECSEESSEECSTESSSDDDPPYKAKPKPPPPKSNVPPRKMAPKTQPAKSNVPPRKVAPKTQTAKINVPPRKVAPKKQPPKSNVSPRKVAPKTQPPTSNVPSCNVAPKTQPPTEAEPICKAEPKIQLPTCEVKPIIKSEYDNKCGVCMVCKVADDCQESTSKVLTRKDIMDCTSDSELTDDECKRPKEDPKCPPLELVDDCGQPIVKKKDEDDEC